MTKLLRQKRILPQDSNQELSKYMMRLYGGTGLQFIPIDYNAKVALDCIYDLYREMYDMVDEYKIAMTKARIADLKQERLDYLEHCWLHNRFRRS